MIQRVTGPPGTERTLGRRLKEADISSSCPCTNYSFAVPTDKRVCSGAEIVLPRTGVDLFSTMSPALE